MTSLSRRALLAGASASAASAWLISCSGPSAPSTATIEQTLADHFGADIARSEPARRFATDLSAWLATNPTCTNPWDVCASRDTRIIQSFLESTTFLASRSTGTVFDYIAIFDPWAAPCASQLVAPL